MAKTYQAEHFTGAQLDDFMQKVLSGDIAGRGLEIDESGQLSCSVQGYSKLVYSYVHTGNNEIHPTELDISTGIFTAPLHGYPNHRAAYVAMNGTHHIGTPYAYLPGGLLLGETTNTSTNKMYYVQVIDENHFGLSGTSTGDIITFTENAGMDLSKFHFEDVGVHELTIEGLNLRECLMVVKGKIHNNYRHIHPTNRISFGTTGNLVGGIGYDATMGTDSYGSCYFGRPGYNYTYGTLEFKMLGERQVYQVNNVDYIMYESDTGKPLFKHNRQYYHMILEDDFIPGIYMGGSLNGGMFNGTTVEVYAK